MIDWTEHSNYKKGLIECAYVNVHCIDGSCTRVRIWRWTAPSKKKDGSTVTFEANTLKNIRHMVSRYRNDLDPEESK